MSVRLPKFPKVAAWKPSRMPGGDRVPCWRFTVGDVEATVHRSSNPRKPWTWWVHQPLKADRSGVSLGYGLARTRRLAMQLAAMVVAFSLDDRRDVAEARRLS